MSAKAVSEVYGKTLLNQSLSSPFIVRSTPIAIESSQSFQDVVASNSAFFNSQDKYVIKPDQLIKRRGKLGLVKCGGLADIEQWYNEKRNTSVEVGRTVGKLKRFIIEPFVAHDNTHEKYVAIFSERHQDTILYYDEGGVDIGDVDAKAARLVVPVADDDETQTPSCDQICSQLLGAVNSAADKKVLCAFLLDLYAAYKQLFCTYVEINPFLLKDGKVYVLDLAAKLDETANFICSERWRTPAYARPDFPPPFGRDLTQEVNWNCQEEYIADLDAKTGASLKLTILNRDGRIWTMVAGGGSSVVFTDTICDLGGANELANYGEYSGDPSETQTYEYAKTILKIMTEGTPRPEGKVLIIGGSIANFTNVAKTFKGIIHALEEFKPLLHEHQISVYVRRGGPNYQEGLRAMKELGRQLGIGMHVFGPETHMTAIVGAALGQGALPDLEKNIQDQGTVTTNILLSTVHSAWKGGPPSVSAADANATQTPGTSQTQAPPSPDKDCHSPPPKITKYPSTPAATRTSSKTNLSAMLNGQGDVDMLEKVFNNNTKAIVWGQQLKAIQGMLDFDFVCSRKTPSVVASTYPLSGDHKQKFYFGHKEILIPSYKSMAETMKRHPDASVFVSFASMRSVYETTLEALTFPQIRCIAIIAEGVPENQTRRLIKMAGAKQVLFIGPATVGGIIPGSFKIGNTGGMMDNILASKLYRPGSVAYVSRSGGMSNELNNIIGHNTDGVLQGVAIGGDRYPGSRYSDHIKRYQADDNCKAIVMLGEVGGTLEYEVVDALKSGEITKPLIAWCIGTCAEHITSEVQFGHAGASANAASETAASKNAALKAAGAIVPASFNDLGIAIKHVYDELVAQGKITPKEEKPAPAVPMDYTWARELGLIRKPASFMTSMTDERGDELLYAGMPISKILESDMGVGGTLSLLWFQRRLPQYATKFIEMCLVLTADHGPAVSGAHNTIICARAGKDLISSLVSGLLTIGDRFGGALDGAARMFSEAYDCGLSPMQFVNKCRKDGKLIMGIGHRVKSLNNPDKRVEILKRFALDRSVFKQATPLLEYAIAVEQITTSKKPNLILNVDGAIGVLFVDILRESGSFTKEESSEMVEIGALNGLFVLGRSMGFIGHYLDQKRLKQTLYRHPWDDITYMMPELQG